ncbi:MAG: TIGR01777 family oxidoreductase [Bacteroidota bacterium]
MGESKNIILLAGGTGFIGKELIAVLSRQYEVRVLTRDKKKCGGEYFYWNPDAGELDERAAEGVSHIVNLCGAGITDKRWTARRKQELYDSRIEPAAFLFSKRELFPGLKQYISASGVNCFDWNKSKVYTEEDSPARDYLSQLVADWEKAADQFETICPVTKIRISFVISTHGGGLKKIEKPVQMGFGSVLASGNQAMPWIQLHDLARIFAFVIENKLAGVYHAAAGNTTNRELTQELAKKNGKRLWMPAVPAFMLKLILGEMASLVIYGVKISNDKIKNANFVFDYPELSEAVKK